MYREARVKTDTVQVWVHTCRGVLCNTDIHYCTVIRHQSISLHHMQTSSFSFGCSRSVATADFPSSFSPFICILLRHFNHCHLLPLHPVVGLRFLFPGCSILSMLLPIHPSSFLRTCPYHLSLASRVFSPNRPTCAVPLMYSFLILSILVTPNENRNIFHCVTSMSILPSDISGNNLFEISLKFVSQYW